ncbi:hypothetical protein [Siccirubricoccus sp. G192]|uniref:hypothetical protein n=1 Tax=Siccirubricoccus sp. G192 TaxID=2849651 RepID=UPI001C2BCB79|nr:hypothetical protein [Siccirubricoccus sp. G192]MBV1796330.1 hypothetical protein [Siccirubricoccus sp. G192]
MRPAMNRAGFAAPASGPGLLPWAPELTGETVEPAPAPGPSRMRRLAALLLAFRRAWRQLRADRARQLPAIAGIVVACANCV